MRKEIENVFKWSVCLHLTLNVSVLIHSLFALCFRSKAMGLSGMLVQSVYYLYFIPAQLVHVNKHGKW